MTEEALELLAESGLDGMNVDVKGDKRSMQTYCELEDEVVWRNCRKAKVLGVWVEVTTLVIPGVTDGPKCLRGIAERIFRELGPGTPWHVTRYEPAYGFSAPATLPKVLAEAYEIGREAGLDYVYMGNLNGGAGEDTYCPACQARLIARSNNRLVACDVTQNGLCSQCGHEIPGRGWPG
jgi:pyruvate formate lyase activating enzyme